MRVLAVANWDLERSPTPWALQRLERLRTLGVQVGVLAVDCVGEPLGYLRLWRALGQRLRSERYDLVAPLYGSVLGLLCALQRQRPCALSLAGSDLNGRTHPGRLALADLCVPASQLACFFSAAVSVRNREMREAIWWPPSRRAARVIPSGVDVARFCPRDRREARRARGLPPGGARVLFVAAQAAARPYKRLALAEAALALLPEVTLEVVDALTFDEMPLAYASADALVLTSRDEGSPNCVKEALACAIPVISVDVGDVREVMGGLTNCAVVAADPEALAGALAATLTDGRGCPDGPARMAAVYSLGAMTAEFARFYREVGASQTRNRNTSKHSA